MKKSNKLSVQEMDQITFNLNQDGKNTIFSSGYDVIFTYRAQHALLKKRL